MRPAEKALKEKVRGKVGFSSCCDSKEGEEDQLTISGHSHTYVASIYISVIRFTAEEER